MLNVSYNAKRIAEILETLRRGALVRRDVIANRSTVNYTVVDGKLTFGLDLPGSGPELFAINPTALGQIASTLSVPTTFLKRLVEGYEVETGRGKQRASVRVAHPDLAATILTTLSKGEPRKHLFRFMGERLRAVLSDRYRDVDNLDLLSIVAELAQTHEWDVWDLRYDDDGSHFRVILVDKRVGFEIGADAPGHHQIRRFAQVYPTVTVTNSETGQGKCRVVWGFVDAGCANGFVGGVLLEQIHLGVELETGLLTPDDTMRARNELLQFRLRDAITQGMDPDQVCERLTPVEAAMNMPLDPVRAVEALGSLGVTQAQRDAVTNLLMRVGHPLETLWDLQWGITAIANPEHRERSGLSDPQVGELEELAGKLLLDAPTRELVLA